MISSRARVCSSCGTALPERATLGTPARDVPKDSLVPCDDCGRMISVRAAACPHCGAPRKGAPRTVSAARPDWGFEWRSKAEFLGYPVVHVAVGRKDGKLRVAKGIIAIGQFAIGLVTVAQFGIGFLFGFGQFILGFTAVAQFAVAVLFGLGQFATGYVAIGQFALGYYGLGQLAFARFGWDSRGKDPVAQEFFRGMLSHFGFFEK